MGLIKALKKFRKTTWIALVFLLLLLVAGPTAKWIWPGFWWGKTLVVLMNENEARPCGGFATAYGEINLPWGGVELHNSFAFPPTDLGQNREPLKTVSLERKFWDLGDTANQAQCAQQFAEGYQAGLGERPNRVLLVQSGVVERWLEALGGIKVNDLALDETNFFATTSRIVADIDRHDEAALAERKDPLRGLGKKLLVTTIAKPWRWPLITRSVGRAERDGALYWHQVDSKTDPVWSTDKARFAVLEWNLGGGKSSRYLDKQWRLQLSQITADTWDATLQVDVTHLGGQDEPLSQTWRGVFELLVPGQDSVFIAAEIAPGKSWSADRSFRISRKRLQSSPGLYQWLLWSPAYQNWETALQVSALPQQALRSAHKTLDIKENTATWSGALSPQGESFSLVIHPDEIPPFLTWHKPLPAEVLSAQNRYFLQHREGDVLVELHFNEPVSLVGRTLTETSNDQVQVFRDEDLAITLIDRDYDVPDYTENPPVTAAILLPDKTTMVLNVRPEQYQTDERFYLEFAGVADRWGNQATIANRTVITR